MTKPQHARRTPNKLLGLVGLTVLAVMAMLTPAVMATTGDSSGGHSGGGNEFPTDPRTPVRLEGLSDRNTAATAVNDHGVVVGSSANESGGSVYPVVWDADGNIDRVGSLPFSVGGAVQDINNRGEIVGSSFWNVSDGGPGTHHGATYWDADHKPHTLWAFDAEAAHGIAHAINEDGTIVGEAVDEFGNTRAVAWEREGDQLEFRDLGVGNDSKALDINDHGDIVGVVQGVGFVIRDGEVTRLSESAPSRANTVNNRPNFFVGGELDWDYAEGRDVATFWQGASANTAKDLPNPDNAQTVVEGMNDAGSDTGPGDMVGGGTTTGRNSSFALLWAHTGETTRLEQLDGYKGAFAHAINENGLIVGVSIHDHTEHATIWRP